VEQVLIDVIDACIVTAWTLKVEWATITVGIEDVMNSWDQWAESCPLIWLACCEAYGTHGSAMEATDIREYTLTTGMPAADL